MEGDKENNLNSQPESRSDKEIISFNSWPLKEKVVSGIILILAFFALFLGYFQISRIIDNSLIAFRDFGEQEHADSSGRDGSDQLAYLNQLKEKDTDQDGLSDYQELYIYQTSPYLSDSDSDGFSDRQEIEGGYDPNCPGEENCSFSRPDNGEAAVFSAGGVETPSSFGGTETTVAELREILIAAGIPQEQLDQLSDQELLEIYAEVAEGQENFSGDFQSQGAGVEELNFDSLEDLKGLSGAEIRTLLIQEGAPEEILAQVTDQELKEMFLSRLEEAAESD